jgi:hypothetical protein
MSDDTSMGTNPTRDPSGRLHALIDRLCNDAIDPSEFAELQERLRDDHEARRLYLEAMELHAALRKSRLPAMHAPGAEVGIASGGTGDLPDSAPPRRRLAALLGKPTVPPGRLAWAAAALAAAILVAATLMIRQRPVVDRARTGQGGGVAVATLVACEGVRWSGGMPTPPAVGAPLSIGQVLRLDAGTARLRFDRDALVTLEGPAEVELRSAMRVRAVRGKVTTRVGPEARGFTIETPSAEVVDLGTEFGLEVDDSDRTGVVVFQGAIDLSYDSEAAGAGEATQARSQKRLNQGEALRVSPHGDMSRIVSVERLPGGGRWSTGPIASEDAVILHVGDNIRGLLSTKYYQIVPRGLAEDVPAYVDRPHQWNGLDGNGLPGPLRHADYIMPFNDDKRSRDIRVTVELARPAALFVFFDDRAEVPAWLAEQFTDTGWDIGLDEGPSLEKDLTVDRGPGRSIDAVFSVWRRDVDRAGDVTLGAMVDVSSGKAMYGIAASAIRDP